MQWDKERAMHDIKNTLLIDEVARQFHLDSDVIESLELFARGLLGPQEFLDRLIFLKDAIYRRVLLEKVS